MLHFVQQDSAIVDLYEGDMKLKEHHPNITILRHSVAGDGKMLVIFLKDTTFVDKPEDERFFAGFVSICEEMPGENFFIATLYHEWFIIDNV